MLFDRAVNGPKAAVETRPIPWEELGGVLQRVFTGMDEPANSKTNAEKLSPVAAAHRILTNGFAMIPFSVYRRDGEYRLAVDDVNLHHLLKVRPNEYMSPFMCAKTVMSDAFWHGVGYCWNRRDDQGRIVARLPLPAECCTIRKDPETGTLWYEFSVDGVQRTFGGYELSMLFFESYDGIRGRGLLDLAREAIAADAMAQRYNKKFYQNGGKISGIVEIDNDADKPTRDKVRAEFARYASDDAFAVAVIDHGMKYNPIGVNQADAQFIESRQFSVEEISRFTGIPKYMLQIGKEAYNSNAQQRVDYVTDTLMQYVIQWEQENRYKLLSRTQRDAGWYIKGNVDVLLRADPVTRADFYAKLMEHSIVNADECRAKEELNPIPNGLGKQFLASKNLGSLESILRGDD